MTPAQAQETIRAACEAATRAIEAAKPPADDREITPQYLERALEALAAGRRDVQALIAGATDAPAPYRQAFQALEREVLETLDKAEQSARDVLADAQGMAADLEGELGDLMDEATQG